MMTVEHIVSLWPSAEILGDDLLLKYRSHARLMKRRGSIPERYWPRLIAAAEARGITGVTYETLVLAHQQRSPPASVASVSAAG